MSDKFLKNTKTGQVVKWNPHLKNKTHMVPYTPEWVSTDAKTPVECTPCPDGHLYNKGVPQKESLPSDAPADSLVFPDTPVGDSFAGQEVGPPLLDKGEADSVVKQLFGKDVSKVTVVEMTEMAETEGVEIPWEKPTKLQLITALYQAGFTGSGE